MGKSTFLFWSALHFLVDFQAGLLPGSPWLPPGSLLWDLWVLKTGTVSICGFYGRGGRGVIPDRFIKSGVRWQIGGIYGFCETYRCKQNNAFS